MSNVGCTDAKTLFLQDIEVEQIVDLNRVESEIKDNTNMTEADIRSMKVAFEEVATANKKMIIEAYQNYHSSVYYQRIMIRFGL